MTLRVAVLFSGGKDSAYAIWVGEHQGWEVSLVTVRPRSDVSRMFHYPNVEWTHLQAEAMGLSHEIVPTTGMDEMADLQHTLAKMKSRGEISGLAAGAVASDYQKTRFDNMCDAIGLKSYAPLWHKRPRLLVEDLRRSGFRIIITAVAAMGLDESWLGRELTEQGWSMLDQLSKVHGIHLTGEGGEYETFVIDAPNFERRVSVDKTVNRWDGQSGYLVIEQASLVHKSAN